MGLTGLRLARLRLHWNWFARRDPLWAILTEPDRKGGRWSLAEFFQTGEDDVARLIDQLQLLGLSLPTGRALDFGCGIGRVTSALANHFDEAVGVDIAPTMLDFARQTNAGRTRCRFVLNNRPNLRQFPDEAFDFAYSKLVLQHMPPKLAKGYLRELLRVLRRGGLLVFQMPTPIEHPVVGGRLKRSMPTPAVALYRRIKKLALHGIEFPKMEVHGIPNHEVIRLVEESSGMLIEALPDQSHGDASRGYLYIVAKTAMNVNHPDARLTSSSS
jgi:ubiquinone/menaquinone biosynthesis C-methylase UbiE